MELPTIKRKYPSKKWKDSEILKMLNFIVINPDNFEQPTAQIYYRQMLKEIQISATWDIVRWKMRYLKQKYKKALELQKLATAELEFEYKDKIYNICPHFDLLSQIFGDNHCEYDEIFQSSKLSISEDSNSETKTFIKTETTDPSYYEIIYDKNLASTTNSNDYESSLLSENLSSSTTSIANQVPVSPKQVVSPSTTTIHKMNNSTSKASVKISNPRSVQSSILLNSSTSDLILSQSEQTNLDLERRKIDIEEYKIKRELDLEEKKIEHNFELRKLEIEKDERIAKYEIEMRYKHKTNNMDLS